MKYINQIVKNLKRYKPKKVILFGSRAWGKPGKDSDIDLLIIKKTKNFNISTGGGAMLEFLAGKKLPGIEALKNNFYFKRSISVVLNF